MVTALRGDTGWVFANLTANTSRHVASHFETHDSVRDAG